MTECCSNNCSFALKEKSDGDDMVRHKSSKLKKHNENRGWTTAAESSRSADVTAGSSPVRYSMVTTR